MDPAQRDDVRLQAAAGRPVACEAAGERARADRRRRRVQRRALPDRQGQRQRLHALVARQGRGARQVHRAVHAQGALRVVPRHDRQSARRGHHRARVRGQVRRSEEARGDRRHRPLDARQLPAEPRHDHGPAPRLLHGRPALHRPRGARGRRGQCLAHGRLPLGQVRPRLGVHGHHQPGRLGEHQGLAQAEAAAPADASTSRPRHDPHLDAHGQGPVQRHPRAAGHVDGHRPEGDHRRGLRGRGRDEPARARRPQGVVGPDGGARRGRAVLPLRPRRREEAPRRGGLPQGLPGDAWTSPRTARPSWSTRASSS